jgi:peptide/nickel transport system substrate-binding protein
VTVTRRTRRRSSSDRDSPAPSSSRRTSRSAEHIWSTHSLEEIGNFEGADPFLNEPPVVGTGPYQAAEFEPGNFVRFVRNPNDWREDKGAADEVIIQHFASTDTAVQALKTGEIDYVRGVLADQFTDLADEPDIQTVEGISNGYTELSFNTGGNSAGYGGSTAARSDIAFRDALGYAIDQDALVEATLGGYGAPGTTIIPPFHPLARGTEVPARSTWPRRTAA